MLKNLWKLKRNKIVTMDLVEFLFVIRFDARFQNLNMFITALIYHFLFYLSKILNLIFSFLLVY
jgi:hypothetical protein